ncbi:BRCT domain-containing protein [Sediminicola luteus]|uniref:GOLD domain-containing protein n=1 Tax=Sediminicola luteus TaxID=319238 RepID=A0A2A4GD43_9FLAO|nr:hypothetical protein [Sediminicola luteus]PCE66373.1 hypothetical protein B7P33_03500 [Sediminicola luteus]
MRKYVALMGGLFMALTLSSCDLDDDGTNVRFTALRVLEADLPEAFERNKTYELDITFLRPNSCTYFEGFDVEKEALTTRKVVVIGSEIIDSDSNCQEIATEVTRTMDFIVLYDETYTFRFWNGRDDNGDDIYLEYEVPVIETASKE